MIFSLKEKQLNCKTYGTISEYERVNSVWKAFSKKSQGSNKKTQTHQITTLKRTQKERALLVPSWLTAPTLFS